MVDYQEYIVNAFEKHFSQYRNAPIVLYGLGGGTQIVLEHFQEYRFVGLMDGDESRLGEVQWGLPIINCETAHEQDVKLIVIIARAANVPVIFHRIAEACEKYQIRVCDINGNDLKNRERSNYHCPDEYEQITAERLKKEILDSDVVSFDIFDTLLMRSVLNPADIFYNMALEGGVIPPDFAQNRMAAERELYSITNPTLEEIYAKMVEHQYMSSDTASEIMEIEVQRERDSLTARKAMLEIVRFAKTHQKVICCTSDMYLQAGILRQFLEENGYPEFDAIFVSCEYRTPKCERLFQFVQSAYPNRKILHIGDNREADISIAQAQGIDKTFFVPSALNMLEDSAAAELLDKSTMLKERNTIGEFISVQFNDPFLFSKTKGKCLADSCRMFGYSFLEPILASVVNWLVETAKGENVQMLLLPARDGWVISKMLDILQERDPLPFPYLYFYTSRSACLMAGIKNTADIEYASAMQFFGSTEEMLVQRFGLEENQILPRKAGEDDHAFLLRHEPMILQRSQQEQEYYQKYIDSLPVAIAGKKVGFFDFVAGGTCQMYLKKIFSWDMLGLYVIQIINQDVRREALEIESMFHNSNLYESNTRLFTNYYYMESLLTSLEPTLKHFSPSGCCILGEETRTDEQLDELREIHQGILMAFQNRIDKGRLKNVSPIAADIIFDFIQNRKKCIQWEIDYFQTLELEDEFCNRRYNLAVAD